MYATPTTATRTAPQPAGANQPPRPRWRLAGRDVPQEMFYAAEKEIRAGSHAFLAVLTEHEDEIRVGPDDCANCLSAGYLGLDVTMVGPLKDAPGGDKGLRPAFARGAWWLVARSLFPCPQCNDRKVIEL